ncbi:MAG: hypothetical protein Q4B85_05185 [Lachnospiraceae bacterium]|nr:hypothetical protein [Lachnospiraceae bacterium]
MLALRDRLKNLYGEYDRYILPVIKYALALFSFISINRMLGYMQPLNNVVLILALSAVCGILPWNGIPVLGVLLVILHCFGLGMEVGVCAVVLYMVLLIFYFRFVPGDGLALVLTAATCNLGFPGIVPIGLGLMRGPVSALTAVCGMISWFFIRVVNEIAAPMKLSPDASLLSVVQGMLEGMMNNRELLLYVLVFGVVVLVVSLIKSTGVSWCAELAVLLGGVLQVALAVLLAGLLGAELNLTSFMMGTVLAVLVSLLLNWLVYDVDYKRAEYLQFEDDTYVYYVKAIPKKCTGPEAVEETLPESEQE